MRFGLLDEHLNLSDFAVDKTCAVLEGGDPGIQIARRIRQYLDTAMEGCLPAAVTIGFPSTIDRSRRVVCSTPNVKGLNNLPAAELLEKELGVPVYVNRDVNFLLLHDIHDKGLKHAPIVLGFYIGTGLGNAVSINGRLLLGKNGAAAELGHIPVYGLDEMCGCGNTGCMEAIASGMRLEKLRQKFFPDTPIGQIFEHHGDSTILLDFVECLSLPIATEITLFDPDYVVVGGGIPQMAGFPTAYLEQCIHRHTRKPYPSEGLEIRYSSPGQENGVIGAGIYAFKRIENPKYL